MKPHPSEADLALFAGGEATALSRYFLNRHIRQCRQCMEHVAAFELLRVDIANARPPELDWSRLAAEMRANIRLGLEAGECVRTTHPGRQWSPRLAVALASLLLLVGASFVMKDSPPVPVARERLGEPVLESTQSGVELRTGQNSMTILNRQGAVADQTVSAQGAIRSRYIDGDTGAVTINNVYLE